MRFAQLNEIITGKLITTTNDFVFSELSIDSRSVANPTKTLFFAIQGVNHDGHDYITALYDKGVRQFIITHDVDTTTIPEASIMKCPDGITALQELAIHHRNQFALEVVGITGSNGKTIVKEWLNQLMSPDLILVKSPKSYNSQVGVPLSVWQIKERHQMGIFEAGISTRGEMEKIAPIISPKFGIFTTIGPAHNQGFASIEEKIEEKLQLFKQTNCLIYCRDHELIHRGVVQKKIDALSWGEHPEANIVIHQLTKENHSTTAILTYKERSLTLRLPFNDTASVENAMHCIVFMLFKGYSEDVINKRISQLQRVKMRLELKQGINNCQLIDDTYNNDLSGLRVALEFMEQQTTEFEKVVIVSDILQSGLQEDVLYSEFSQMLDQHNITQLIGIGDSIGRQRAKFNIPGTFYSDTQAFLNDLESSSFANKLILIKGARRFSFEKIAQALEQKIHGTVLEIDLNALTQNLNFYRGQLGDHTKLMVMVKAFAYGSGGNEVAQLLQHHQVDYLGVAYVDEGIALRKSGIQLPIMVMNPTPDSFEKCITHNLEPEIYNFSVLQSLLQHLRNRPIGIHIKIDTGMRRLGFSGDEIEPLANVLAQHSYVEIKSVFTHLAGADNDQHNAFSEQQVARFTSSVGHLRESLSISPLIHVLNSAGILRFPQYQYDMVRLGIGLYGVETNEEYQHMLAPISSLKTVISQIKHIEKGETIGYGRIGIANSNLKIATIAIGYADGFSRAFSNGVGQVYVNGHNAKIIGNVCMDMTMVDVTGIEVAEGDEVEIFGKNISISRLAQLINTIPYEILTSVSNRVKRIFFLD